MKKNFYEILEVSENASPETIERVYKLLVKKYHPDLQSPDKKAEAEEKIKEINRAYDTLSNPTLRREYDFTLSQERSTDSVSIDEFNRLKNEFQQYKNSTTSTEKTVAQDNTRNISDLFFSKKTQEKYQNQKPFFIIKIPTLKNVLLLILSFIITILLLLIIPFTREALIDFYESFPLIKIIWSVISGIFVGIFEAIKSLF